ncbi:hypothetical protein D3C72_2446860 [compost metagenome]
MVSALLFVAANLNTHSLRQSHAIVRMDLEQDIDLSLHDIQRHIAALHVLSNIVHQLTLLICRHQIEKGPAL